MNLQPQWDMFIYLFCIQLLLLQCLGKRILLSADVPASNRNTLIAFAGSGVVFWLVWGGYSTDAWRYLSTFDLDTNLLTLFRWGSKGEQLFWIIGNGFGQLVSDPWPLKIFSALTILILSLAYFQHFKASKDGQLALAYMLLLCTPAFFLLTGNVIRQGLAGAIAIVGALLFLRGNYRGWAVLAILGSLIHQYSVLVFMALPMLKLCKKYLVWIWLLSPLIGLTARYVLSMAGINLQNILPYAYYSEGMYHWEKFLVATIISIIVLLSLRRHPSAKIDFRQIYIFIIAISNTIVIYEVPYERILLFTDLIAPLAITHVLVSEFDIKDMPRIVPILIVVGSMLLWSSSSIVKSLGFL